MKIAHVGTGYIILIWILIVIMLGTVLYIGYRRNSTDLKQLTINEAERLIEVVGVTAQAGIHTLDEIEYLTAQRHPMNRLCRNNRATAGNEADVLRRSCMYRVVKKNKCLR